MTDQTPPVQSQSKQGEPEHRIEIIETEINLLAQIWQSQETSLGQSSIIVKRTMELLAEKRELLGKQAEA